MTVIEAGPGHVAPEDEDQFSGAHELNEEFEKLRRPDHKTSRELYWDVGERIHAMTNQANTPEAAALAGIILEYSEHAPESLLNGNEQPAPQQAEGLVRDSVTAALLGAARLSTQSEELTGQAPQPFFDTMAMTADERAALSRELMKIFYVGPDYSTQPRIPGVTLNSIVPDPDEPDRWQPTLSFSRDRTQTRPNPALKKNPNTEELAAVGKTKFHAADTRTQRAAPDMDELNRLQAKMAAEAAQGPKHGSQGQGPRPGDSFRQERGPINLERLPTRPNPELLTNNAARLYSDLNVGLGALLAHEHAANEQGLNQLLQLIHHRTSEINQNPDPMILQPELVEDRVVEGRKAESQSQTYTALRSVDEALRAAALLISPRAGAPRQERTPLYDSSVRQVSRAVDFELQMVFGVDPRRIKETTDESGHITRIMPTQVDGYVLQVDIDPNAEYPENEHTRISLMRAEREPGRHAGRAVAPEVEQSRTQVEQQRHADHVGRVQVRESDSGQTRLRDRVRNALTRRRQQGGSGRHRS